MSADNSLKYNFAETLYQGSSNDLVDASSIENETENEERSFSSTVQSTFLQTGTRLAKLRLEIVTFLFTFSYTMTQVSSTAMILDKVCLVNFNYSSYICNDLENHTQLKSSVERLATNYQLGHTLIQTAPAALLACFIGPWSDIYGRKFPILLALFGMILDALGSSFCAYFLETRVEYYFIPAIFTGMLGGPVSILAVVYSCASDTTSLQERTMKYAYLAMAAGFAVPFGSAAGGWIYKFLGYPAVFFFSAGGLCLSLIWVIFLLKETRGWDNDDAWSVKLRNLFSCESFKDSFRTIARKRPHQGREQILLLLISVCFLIIATLSTGDINYLFAHHQFGWSNTTYSTINAIYSVITILGLVIFIPLLKYFKTGDPILGLIGTISLFGKSVGVGLSWETWIYHIANLFGGLGGCATFAVRSRISKLVSDEDLGKVFSFVASAESLLPILTSVLMSQIFNASLNIFPGMPYIVQAFFMYLPLGVFSWMTCLPKMSYEDFSKIRAENVVDYASI